MCSGKGPQPIANNTTPDISNWSPQKIQEFLVKYPTLAKAQSGNTGATRLSLGFNPTDVWSQVATSASGKEFLAVHGAARRKAGDATEADDIAAFLQGADPTKITRLPTLPPPKPSEGASSVSRADISNNMAGNNSLRIPLVSKPTTPRLPKI